jgi:hypothetical protein
VKNLIFTVALLILVLLPVGTFATTFHTITIDGVMTDWAPDELICYGANSVDFYATWDANSIYLGILGVDINSNEIEDSFNLDTNWPPSGGSTSPIAGAEFQANIAPEKIVRFFNPTPLAIFSSRSNGSNGWFGWSEKSTWNKAIDATGYNNEVAIPRSFLGNPPDSTAWGLIIWVENNANDSCWSVAPNTNSTSTTLGNILLQWEFRFPSMGPGVSPASGVVVAVECSIWRLYE